MSDERTQNLPDSASFEERVLAHLDGIAQRLHRLEDRFDKIESNPV